MSREVRSPVYQIDFTAVDAGKRIATTKRRIRWRFGFTNQDALAAGETGTACRGEEHDITLIWSLTSGKRLVLADGQEVHYSNSRSQVFDFSWTMRGNHVLKVIAHATSPMNAHPNFRQYDFFVDGMSFFSMPKVYRLGLTGADHVPDQGALALAHSSRTGYGNYSMGGPGMGSNAVSSPRGPSSIAEIEAPHNEQEEEAYLREAIKASLSEQENAQNRGAQSVNSGYNNQPQGQQEDLLIDFMSEPGPVPAPAPNSGYDAFAVVPSTAPQVSAYAQPPPPQQPPAAPMYAPPAPAAAPPAFDSFAAPPPAAAAPPTPIYNYDYSQPPAAPPAQPPAPTAFAPMPPSAPPAPAPAPPSQPEQAPAAPVLSMAPQNTGLGSNANDAYAKFASMDQFDLVKPKNRSNPFDDAPAPAANTGTLADMKAKNANVEKKEVMKNTMVVAPQQGNQWGGYNNYNMQGQAPMAGGMNGMGAAAPAQPMMQPPGQFGMPPAPSMGGSAMPQQGYQQPGQYGYGQQPPQQPGQYPPMQGQPPSMQGYPSQQQGYGTYGQQPF